MVEIAPAATPAAPPRRARRIASARNWARICPLVAPKERRRPISERRSRTPMSMMLATPTAPTTSETAPRPRKRLLSAPWGSARAVRAADGWLTFTSLGASGSAVASREGRTAGRCLGEFRHELVAGGEGGGDGVVDLGGEEGGFEDAG